MVCIILIVEVGSFSGRKIARNVMAMTTGEAPYLTATAPVETLEKKAQEETFTELPEIVQTVQQAVCQTIHLLLSCNSE